MARNPMKDMVAVVGVGSTAYGRDLGRTELSLGLEAAINAIEDAGIDRQEIDGICGTGLDPLAIGGAGFLSLQGALGIERTNWVKNGWLGSFFVYAVNAVFSGTCDVALLVQSYTRGLGMSRSAANDPFRVRANELGRSNRTGPGRGDYVRRWVHGSEPYAAWMARYLHDYGATKDVFARIAVNNRTHALTNPRAVMRTPITMDDYHSSRMIWEPMQLLDMDVPVDCAEAMVITTAERARDMPHKPVYVHAASLGQSRVGEFYENSLGWTENSLWIALAGALARSDITADDFDLFFPYDGFSISAVSCIEATGFCKPGEADDLLASSWDADAGILRINGRTLVSTNGGGLSQGRAGGSNFITEAVRQLRGTQGDRQVVGAKTAFLCPGCSLFHDPAAVVLRADWSATGQRAAMSDIAVGFMAGDLKRAAALEALPIDSLWVGGHVGAPGDVPEAMVRLARLSAVTERVQIGTAILLLPLYPPAVVAKQISDIDRATGGRVVFGVGIGGEYPNEFRACRVPVTERGPRTDEAITFIRELWTGEEITHDGRFYPAGHVRITPPDRPGGPPIVVAGRKEAAMRRAALLGDGWMPYLYSARRYAASVEAIRAIATDAGRDLRGFGWYAFVFVNVDADGDRARRGVAGSLGSLWSQDMATFVDRVAVAGTADEVRTKLCDFVDAGARHFIFTPSVGTDGDVDRVVHTLVDEVLPVVRERAAT